MPGAVTSSAATVTTREKAPTILTAEGARRLTARIRDALSVGDDLLAQAFQGRAWEALDYPTWAAYCDGELPELRHLKMKTEPRKARVAALLEEGASRRDIAAATGASLGQVQKDVDALRSLMNADPSPTPESRADQIVRLVAARGDRGATSPEVARLARCSQGAASGCLSRLQRQGRVLPTREHRGGFGVYVIKDS